MSFCVNKKYKKIINLQAFQDDADWLYDSASDGDEDEDLNQEEAQEVLIVTSSHQNPPLDSFCTNDSLRS